MATDMDITWVVSVGERMVTINKYNLVTAAMTVAHIQTTHTNKAPIGQLYFISALQLASSSF
jgi:hypothetical protein